MPIEFNPKKWRESLFTNPTMLLYALEEGNELAKNKYIIISQFKRIISAIWKDFQKLEEKDYVNKSNTWKSLMKKLENSPNQYKKTKMNPKNTADEVKINYLKDLAETAKKSLVTRPLPTPRKKVSK